MTNSDTRKYGLLATLYVSQYLGFSFFGVALVAILRERGASLEQIAAVETIGIIWVLKPLWAPLVDRVGSYRRWLLVLQPLLGLTLLVATPLDAVRDLGLLLLIFGVIAVLSATQDIATDAIAVGILKSAQRGIGNGIQIAAGYLGGVLGGGLTLVVYDLFGWAAAIVTLAVATVAPMLMIARMSDADPGSVAHGDGGATDGTVAAGSGFGVAGGADAADGRRGVAGDAVAADGRRGVADGGRSAGEARMSGIADAAAVKPSVLGVFRRREVRRWMLIVLPPCAIGLFGAYSLVPLALVDRNWELREVAIASNVVGGLVGIAAGLAVGVQTSTRSRQSVLVGTQLAQVVVIAAMALAWQAGSSAALFVASMAVHATVAASMTIFSAITMDLCDKHTAGTDYSVISSFVMFLAIVGGVGLTALAGGIGYTATLAIGAILAAVGVVVAVRIYRDTAATAAEPTPAAV